MNKLRILFLPFAGGSAQISNYWKRYLNDGFSIIPIELAGRGSRFKDKFYTDFDQALDDLIISVKAVADEPYVIYGHSFGALLTYELYYRLLENNCRLPEHLFFSGSVPPNRRCLEKKTYDMPDTEFMKEVIKFNGMEKEVLENKQLMELVLPILRADFKLLDLYNFSEKPCKIEKNVTILYGNDMTYDTVKGWSELAENNIDFYHIDGDHFFIKKNVKEVMDIIKDQLCELV